MEVKRNGDEFCSLNCARCSPEVSTFSIMSESATPALVYQRKKVRRNSVAVSPGQASANPSDGCFCSTSSEAPSVAAKEGKIVSLVDRESEVDGSMDKLPVRSGGDALISKQKCITGCFSGKAGKVPYPGGAPEVENLKSLDMCSVNDNYSSSKSILEHSSASLRTDVDDTGECSSSSALHVEGLKKNLSERDACISILRSQGVLKGASRSRICTSSKDLLASSNSSYTQTCKVCNHSETIRRMLICDQCESAFHVNCCNSLLEKIPFDEWFCHACVTKCNPLETTTSEALNVSSDTSEERTATSNGELGIMASVLSDTEPHTSLVRVGPEFQAEVPRWSGPSIDEVDTRGEPSVIFPSECVSTYGCCSNKPPRLASIGNWLQCREVINESGDAQETICGKWRRAPLFEVQTEKWECFCSVLWDPAHADCAVPQELDTEQVLKQLKYIEMLRPQLSTKKRKLNPAKSVGSQALLKSARNGRNR